MPSPDITPYLDLTLYDKQPQDVYADALIYAQTVLPEFQPVSGSIEDAVLQSTSSMTAETIAALNRLPSGLVEVILQLFGITRDSGVRASGSVWFEAIDDSGYTVPAGTRLGYLDSSDIDAPVLYTFDTTDAVSIPAGLTGASVGVIAALNNEYPAIQDGEILQLITPVAFVDTAEVYGDIDVGKDAESDAEYFSRAVARLQSYTAALVLPPQFEQYVLATYSDAYRVKAYSRVNPVNDDFSDPLENGYLTVYISKVGGASLTSGAANVIEEDLESRAVAGLNINVEPPKIVNLEITATVTLKPGFQSADVERLVLQALNRYVHPDYWNWSDTLYYNELVSYIDQVEGVGRVVDLLIDGMVDDYEFLKYGTLPTNTSTITVSI